MAEIIFIPFGGSAAGGTDHFAPKYLVGNVPAGDDPAVYNAGGFQYIPDPGDGSGIAAALLQLNGPGDVWIRPGTYTSQARFIIPPGVRVWGAGYTTIVVGSGVDNTVWEVGDRSELGWIYITHPGGDAGVGEAAVLCRATTSYVHDLAVDASAATSGGTLIAGVGYVGLGGASSPNLSRLHNNVLVGPQDLGSLDPTLMYANIRGLALAENDVVIVDVQSNTLIAGDAGIVGLGATVPVPAQGVSFIVNRTVIVGPNVVGIYCDFSPLLMTGPPSVVLAFASTIIGGIILLNTFQYDLGSTLVLNLTDQGAGPVTVPGIVVSEPVVNPNAPPSSVNIHECTLLQWGDPADPAIPQMLIGQGAELVRSAHIANCRFISNFGVTPVVLGAGCSNSIVALNTSDGSGGVGVLDLGAINEIAHNLWT